MAWLWNVFTLDFYKKSFEGKEENLLEIDLGLNLTVKEKHISSWLDLQYVGCIRDVIFAL